MASIFERKLLIVSGKGGVGKSCVASALAVAAAKKGKRVALVEIGAREHLYELFGKKRKAGYKGQKVWSPGKSKSGRKKGGLVNAMHLDPQNSLREFVVKQVKIEAVYRAIFQNRVMRYFTAAAPGLEDLLMLGKIIHLAEETDRRGKPKWDLVVMDAPSTGHNISFFNSAYAFLQISGVGPMRKRVANVWEFLQDPEKTAFNIVSLPEEMPVNESMELSEALADQELPQGIAVANAVFPEFLDEDSRALVQVLEPRGSKAEAALTGALVHSANTRVGRGKLHRHYVQELREGLDMPLTELPYLFQPHFGVKEIETLAKCLRAA